MANPASAALASKPLPLSAGTGGSASPAISHPTSGAGIGSGTSSLSSAGDAPKSPLEAASLPLPASSALAQSTPLLSDSIGGSPASHSRENSGGASLSPSKAAAKDEPASDPSSTLTTTQMKITRIFQRFLVRCPHTFIAITITFIPLYYGLGKESLAYSAATFVGVGGTVYCLTRAVFLEIIPQWLLPRTDATKTWRHLMNVSYTGFITVIFTSAVWKLPDLSAVQGLCFLTLTFGVPYPFLKKYYPDIDKQPAYFNQKHDIPARVG